MGVSGPDDSAQRRPPRVPELGTPEARERIRRSGAPLDEWVQWPPSKEWLAQQQAEMRKQERRLRVVYWVIGLIVAGFFAWQIVGSGSATPPDCGSPIETPCLNASDRVVIPGAQGGLETLSLDEWREARAEALAPAGLCQDERGTYPC